MKHKILLRTLGVPECTVDDIYEIEMEFDSDIPPRLIRVPIELPDKKLAHHFFVLTGLADGSPYYTYEGRRKKERRRK